MTKEPNGRRRRARALAGAGVVWLWIATACVPGTVPEAVAMADLRAEPTPRPAPAAESSAAGCWTGSEAAELLAAVPAGPRPLRGDPAFDPDALEPEARRWYDALWDAITRSDTNDAITELALSDDLYQYGRTVQTHVVALLTAFRVTGDLALLDEVDRIAELMRSRLRDPWRGTVDGTSGTRDGYLNWVFRAGSSRAQQGKDLHPFDEMRTHALIAEIAWALHNNRDLVSPNGVPYGARADFWTTYLVDHFEAKWRERNAVPAGRFPFLEHESLHATVAFVKYHYYLGSILNDERRFAEARRLSALVLDRFVVVATDAGPAWVWPRLLGPTDELAYLQPTTYARYVIGDAVDLNLEGVRGWADPEFPTRLAATVRAFVFSDRAAEPGFARDIGGGSVRGGLDATDADAWDRFSDNAYAVSSIGAVALWDRSGTIAAVTCEVAEWSFGELRSVHLPAALLLAFASPSVSAP